MSFQWFFEQTDPGQYRELEPRLGFALAAAKASSMLRYMLAAVSLCVVLVAVGAAPKRRGAKPPAKSNVTTGAKARPARVAPSAPAAVDASGDPQKVLGRIQGLYQGLEYDQVIPLATAFLAREDVTLDQRIDAYRLQGSARAIVEDPLEAERPFRLLLRARSEYEMPSDTPPKIMAVFRKVQTEERALGAQMREVERRRIVGGLKLIGEPPTQIRGGQPLKFSFRLKDPTGAVDAIQIPYRRQGEKSFSTLALARGDAGDWSASLSGESTATEKDTTMQYYVETLDSKGPLLMLGSASSPLQLAIAQGLFEPQRKRPIPRWAFFTGVGTTAVLGLATAGLGISLQATQQDFRTKAATDGYPGRQLVVLEGKGNTLAQFATGSLVSLGVAAVATLVMWPFTDFSAPSVEQQP